MDCVMSHPGYLQLDTSVFVCAIMKAAMTKSVTEAKENLENLWSKFLRKFLIEGEKVERLQIACEFVSQFQELEVFYGIPVALSVN